MDVETFRQEMKELIKKGLDVMTVNQIVSNFIDVLDEAAYEKYKEFDNYDSKEA